MKVRGRKKGTILKPELLSRCKICDTQIKKPRIYCSRVCMHQCEVYKDKLRQADRSYMLTEAYIRTRTKVTTPDYKRYVNKVHRLSDKTYLENKHLINPHDFPRTLAGVDEGYQLDHIVSIKTGFESNIAAQELARVENLRMLPWRHNLERNRKGPKSL